MINTGVQGYATFQYLEVLRRSWKFEPDLVLVGFSMNDVTQPYRVRNEHGGEGIDYHGILQDTSAWRGYLINQTGYGRFALSLNFGGEENRALRETINVRRMVEAGPEEEPYFSGWKAALEDLDEMRALAAERGVPMVTLVFPFRFQLDNTSLQRPQRVLVEHAEQSGSAVIELSALLEGHRKDSPAATNIFLDRSHFSPGGHEAVARLLFEELVGLDYLEIDD